MSNETLRCIQSYCTSGSSRWNGKGEADPQRKGAHVSRFQIRLAQILKPKYRSMQSFRRASMAIAPRHLASSRLEDRGAHASSSGPIGCPVSRNTPACDISCFRDVLPLVNPQHKTSMERPMASGHIDARPPRNVRTPRHGMNQVWLLPLQRSVPHTEHSRNKTLTRLTDFTCSFTTSCVDRVLSKALDEPDFPRYSIAEHNSNTGAG